MIYAGKQIVSSTDKLSKVSLDYLYNSIRNPRKEVEAKIRQLRIIKDIDKKRYGLLKKELPYLVCGAFNPPFRRIENFAYTEYFIVDIDHIVEKGLSVEKVRQGIEKDARTVMSFLSPGEDGLKVMFRLKERCYDHGMYSLFYKIFVRQLSETYGLEQTIDARTSDVSRACFISIDPQIYYNPDAVVVDMSAYVDMSNPSLLFDIKKQAEKEIKDAKAEKAVSVEKEKDPDMESIRQIREILKLKPGPTEKNPAHVPEQLNDIIDDIKKYIEETGIQVTEIINIHYGKKIRMTLGLKQSEINLFYGKRGYSVVKSPRCGTNAELNTVSADLINSFIALSMA